MSTGDFADTEPGSPQPRRSGLVCGDSTGSDSVRRTPEPMDWNQETVAHPRRARARGMQKPRILGARRAEDLISLTKQPS